eukprot:6179036-Pleurochrysis_carterae.AAC.5
MRRLLPKRSCAAEIKESRRATGVSTGSSSRLAVDSGRLTARRLFQSLRRGALAAAAATRVHSSQLLALTESDAARSCSSRSMNTKRLSPESIELRTRQLRNSTPWHSTGGRGGGFRAGGWVSVW